MSVTTTYNCNLCYKIITNRDNAKCVYFDSTIKTKDGFGKAVLVDDLKLTDKHICYECIKLIKEFENQLK